MIEYARILDHSVVCHDSQCTRDECKNLKALLSHISVYLFYK